MITMAQVITECPRTTRSEVIKLVNPTRWPTAPAKFLNG